MSERLSLPPILLHLSQAARSTRQTPETTATWKPPNKQAEARKPSINHLFGALLAVAAILHVLVYPLIYIQTLPRNLCVTYACTTYAIYVQQLIKLLMLCDLRTSNFEIPLTALTVAFRCHIRATALDVDKVLSPVHTIGYGAHWNLRCFACGVTRWACETSAPHSRIRSLKDMIEK